MARYEIDSDLAIRIWFDESEAAPGLFQPTYPNGEPFGTKKAAEAWAKTYLKAIEDPKAPLPGDSPEEPTMPRPEPITLVEEPLANPEAPAETPAEPEA